MLVVDDDVRLREMLGRLLGKDHDVTLASSAEEALASMRSGKRYDAIVSDVMMPGMTGVDLFVELERLDRRQAERVIFITGGAFTPATRAFLETAKNPFLEKPFDNRALRELVSSVAAASDRLALGSTSRATQVCGGLFSP